MHFHCGEKLIFFALSQCLHAVVRCANKQTRKRAWGNVPDPLECCCCCSALTQMIRLNGVRGEKNASLIVARLHIITFTQGASAHSTSHF